MDKGAAHVRGKADTTNPATCQACHGQAPHKGARSAKLNDHTARLACQTIGDPGSLTSRSNMRNSSIGNWRLS